MVTRILPLLLLGCTQVVEEPNLPLELIIRCIRAEDCAASMQYMSETLDCHMVRVGVDGSVFFQVYTCKYKEGYGK